MLVFHEVAEHGPTKPAPVYSLGGISPLEETLQGRRDLPAEGEDYSKPSPYLFWSARALPTVPISGPSCIGAPHFSGGITNPTFIA
jgi:hypothetical protein